MIEANVSNCVFAAHRLKVTRLKPPGQLKSCPNGPERQIVVHGHGLAFDLVMRLGRTIATVQRAEAVPQLEAEGGEGKPAPRAEGDLDLFALLDHKFATQGLKEKTKSDCAGPRQIIKSSGQSKFGAD
ncbi:hypothetical protein NKI39_26920 [Mesorhizobium sp. M0664]|uniref:hypothetical protein n=1 Tax=Mesorhizobium sp. M0664 TaxID=2956982 RepID=UPI0033361C98